MIVAIIIKIKKKKTVNKTNFDVLTACKKKVTIRDPIQKHYASKVLKLARRHPVHSLYRCNFTTNETIKTCNILSDVNLLLSVYSTPTAQAT